MSKCVTNMFPSKLDLSKDECRGALRRLELEAYSSVISTFRAQGNLDGNKQNVLDQLRRCFHISEDRHRSEIRRVANNEKLTTISELINGKSFDLEWIREGHRTYPLISRASSYTALHILADHASKVAAFENTDLPVPKDTRRERSLDVCEISGKHITTEDPTRPPILKSPPIFGVSRKDLKRSIDLVTLHSHTKKKHYHHLKPPPSSPNVKIQHLYQTLNTKRPRKTFTKKSKTKASKQSPSRMQFSSYPSLLSSPDEKQHFDGAELQRHLTSQLMPPPPTVLKQQQHQLSYAQPLPTSKKELNLLKINHHHQQQQQQQQQSMEPQAHYIPNNRLKNELLSEPVRAARSGRSKSMSVPSKSNYNAAKYANGSRNNNNQDHIPDPQIIFNTTSSSKMESSIVETIPLENNMDLSSPSMTSPLQLLSTAASCTPKLKVTSPINHHQQQQTIHSSPPSTTHHHHHHHHHNIHHSQPSAASASQLPSLSTTIATTASSSSSTTSTLKTVQNRAIKIIPANTKPMIIKPQNEISKSPQQQQQQQTIISTTPSKFKIQKIQLVMNKNQDGTTTTNISPSATIVSGKAGQLVLSGKGITNTYQVQGTKAPYTILSSGSKVSGGPKVIVQTIDRNFAQQKDESSNERIPENQCITENTPIDFLPVNTPSIANQTTSFPKVIIQKSATTPKQIKLKLGPGSIVNSKIIKGPLPGNLKIQRNINTKGFTVLNTSQIVQIQSAAAAAISTTATTPTQLAPVVISNNESTKTDWEQELDDANRTKEHKDRLVDSSNGSSLAKKQRLDDGGVEDEEVTLQNNNNDDNIIIETAEIESNSNIYAENLPQIDVVEKKQQQTTTPEFVYINTDSELKQSENISSSSCSNPVQENGEGESTKLNGQFEEVQVMEDERPHNGAEAFENLVKSLGADCEADYLKDITDDSQIDENFALIDGNMLDTSISFSRESERIFQ